MPIHDGILNKHRREYVIFMEGNQTLNATIQRFQESGYPENNAYLIVKQSDQQYRATPISDISELIRKLGSDSLNQPLSSLPIPAANRIEHRNTSEAGKSIVNWLDHHPRSTIVVIDDNGYVGLMANVDRGVFDSLILGGLEGEDADTGKDFRADVTRKVAKPTCPHCGHQDFFKYDLDQDQFKCKNCGMSIE